MSGTNDFLPFAADPAANVEPQATYAADTQRTLGQQPGVARSAINNKAIRQATAIAAALAQYLVNITGLNASDDGNQAELLTLLSTGLTTGLNVVSKTANYAASLKDYILCSSASFAVTLPDASATGVKGLQIAIEHNGTSLTQVYTINTTSSQTIGGVAGGSYALYTLGEVLIVISDGANWQIQGHRSSTPISAATAINISATSAYTFTIPSNSVTAGAVYSTPNGSLFTVTATIAPSTTLTCSGTGAPNAAANTLTKVSGTGPSTLAYSALTSTGQPAFGAGTNTATWSRVGKYATVNFIVVQTGSGSTGSGDYILNFPTGLNADLTNLTPYLASIGSYLNQVPASFGAIIPAIGTYAQNTSSAFVASVSAFLFSATSIRLTGFGDSSGGVFNQILSNSTSGNLGNSALGWSISITFPVAGWQP